MVAWPKACWHLSEQAVTTPSMAVSHITMEAYKKFILVALIVQGKIPTLPKYAPQVVPRYIKPLCQAYHDLANAYSTNNPAEVRLVINKHSDTFNRVGFSIWSLYTGCEVMGGSLYIIYIYYNTQLTTRIQSEWNLVHQTTSKSQNRCSWHITLWLLGGGGGGWS